MEPDPKTGKAEPESDAVYGRAVIAKQTGCTAEEADAAAKEMDAAVFARLVREGRSGNVDVCRKLIDGEDVPEEDVADETTAA